MLFTTSVFFAFAATFLVVWPWARRRDAARWAVLVAASFVFYGWVEPAWVLLLLASGLIDFACGLCLVRPGAPRRLLIGLSLTGNLGLLAVFKYGGFLVDNLNAALGVVGASGIDPPDLLLPVGISFYTFQSLSYTLDIYRGRLAPTRNVLHFFAYLAMFPQLVAGPIVRAGDMLPRLRRADPVDGRDLWLGFRQIVVGFTKKVVVADSLAPVVDQAFASSALHPSGMYWWLVMVAFALQIYADFSGYTDIARGLARWMGLPLAPNFDHPYTARSFREFWGRWHISLSTWFRDYVYVPLGGSRQGAARAHRNVWITMLLSGLWHGAAWTFVAWGALHALFVSLERWTRWPERLASRWGGAAVARGLVLVGVVLAWVPFRAASFEQAGSVYGRLFCAWGVGLEPNTFGVLVGAKAVALIGLMVLVEAASLRRPRAGADALLDVRGARAWLEPLALGAMIAACFCLRGPGQAFYYFQF